MRRVLVVATHPDDETLGCGGTILRHRAAGDEVYWLIVTDMSIEEGYDKKLINKGQREINAVAKQYGFKDILQLKLPPSKLDMLPRIRIVSEMGNIFDKIKPDIVYIPNRSDVHSDHRIIFDSIMSSTKTFRCPFIKKIMMYEVISETEFTPALLHNAFVPNSFSDITDFISKKLTIMKIYKSELRPHPFPRSLKNIKALATFRGATAGVKYAEAFMVLKEIW